MIKAFRTKPYIDKLLFYLSILHLLIIYMTLPYVLDRAYHPYIATFPNAAWLRPVILLSGLTCVSVFILWLYNHYILHVFVRYQPIIKYVFVVIFSYYTVFSLLLYPYVYSTDGDYTSLLDMATHGVPVFWQNYLTSIFYLSSFLAGLHPVCVHLVLTFLFSAVLCQFLSACMEYLPHTGQILLAAGSVFVCLTSNRFACAFVLPHRVSFWTVLLLYLLNTLLPKIIKGDMSYLSFKEYVRYSLLFSILAYWRTEAILFLLLMPVCAFISLFLEKRVRHLRNMPEGSLCVRHTVFMGFVISVACYLLLGLPNKLAADPVYKNDYMLVNYSGWIERLRYDEAFDLSYEGGMDDYARFAQIIPTEFLTPYGSGAWHYAAEQSSGNCTVTNWSDLVRHDYEESVMRMVLHNKGVFLKSRIILFLETMGYICNDYEKAPDAFYAEVLVGYGTYHDDVMDELLENGLEPYYLSKMVTDYHNHMTSAHLSSVQCLFMAAVLVISVFLFFAFVRCVIIGFQYILRGNGIQLFNGFLRALSYLLSAIGSVLAFILYYLTLPLYFDLTGFYSIEGYFEILYFALSVLLIIFSVKRKHYSIAWIYLVLCGSYIPIILFAPMRISAYYNGLTIALISTVTYLLCYLSQKDPAACHAVGI